MKDVKIVFSYELVEALGGIGDERFNIIIKNKVEVFGFRKGRRVGDGGRAEIDFATGDSSKDKLVHAKGGGTVHTRMFTHESRAAILVYDYYDSYQ